MRILPLVLAAGGVMAACAGSVEAQKRADPPAAKGAPKDAPRERDWDDVIAESKERQRERDKPKKEDAAAAAFGLGGFICLGVIGLFVYMMPAFVAFARGHQNATAILVLTIFAGWTFAGWVVALVWSFTQVQPRRRRYYDGD
jgi:hypothetical protein